MTTIPVTEVIAQALAQFAENAGANGEWRDPSHADIEFHVNAAGLQAHDPRQQGQSTIGKARRVRAILYAAMDADPAGASKFAVGFLSKVRASGGFREGSSNYVGREAIDNAKAAFDSEGFVLADDGSLSPKLLGALKGPELTDALRAYAVRAQKGAEDAALVAGTGKDLLEATAAHVLDTLNGSYPKGANFQALLGMAFIALDLAVPEFPEQPGELPCRAMERGLFSAAMGVNRLRNKQGTGHGRPFLPTMTDEETKAAIELVGTVAGYMLAKLSKREKRKRPS